MRINFYGVIDLTRSTIQELNRNTDTYIVNVSSMGGFLPVTGQAIYGASKASDAKHKMTKPDDAADMIIKGIENGKLRIFVGSDAKMMDKFYRLMPVRSIDKMADMIRKMTA